MKHIEINLKGHIILIDLEDVTLFESRLWNVESRGYVYSGKRFIGPLKRVLLHRLVLGYTGPLCVDHINGNRLDNRKSNLRLVTHSQNQMNRVKNKKCSSIYKGVCWDTQVKKWKVQITSNHKDFNLGHFSDEKEAALVYDKKALELFGDHALFNFPLKEVQNA